MAESFLSFLDKMRGETADPRPEPQSQPRRTPQPVAVEEEFEPVRTEERKPPKAVAPERQEKKPQVITEEFMDKAYDYAQGILKVVKDNFKNEQRKYMLETMVKSIYSYMGEMYGSTPAPRQQTYSAPPAGGSLFNSGAQTMSEEEWNQMPKVMEGEVAVQALRGNYAPTPVGQRIVTPQGRLGDNYDDKSDITLRTVYNAKGEREVDISAITDKEILEMKVLAGIMDTSGRPKEQIVQSSVTKVGQSPKLIIEQEGNGYEQ